MVEFIDKKIDERMEVIESKLRNSFKAIKDDNDEIRKKIDNLSIAVANSSKDLGSLKETVSKEAVDLNKKIASSDDSFKKFKKDVSADSLRRQVVTEVIPIFNEKIKAGLQSITKENKEMRKDLSAFKSKWTSASEEKLNKGLEEMRANFKKLDDEVKSVAINNIKLFEKQNNYSNSEIKAMKSSMRKSVDAHASLIDQYSTKLEDYSAELEADYNKSKREILASSERKFNALKTESEEEIAKLRGQIAYIKGRVNKELGAEEETKPVAPKLKEVAKEVKVDKKVLRGSSHPSEKNKNIFANLVSLLADESPETKITVKKVEKKPKEIVAKSVDRPTTPVKKLGKQEGKGFFNSIVKSLAD